MSLKWYEEHLQEVVRHNQQLKFQLQLKQYAPSLMLVDLFRVILPEIPPLDHRNTSFQVAIDYYRRAATLSLQKQASKIQFLMAQSHLQHPDLHSSIAQLKKKVSQLQREVQELREEVKQMELNEHKYLGEIALLRSITKKLEYELAERATAHKKLATLCTSNARQAAEEHLKLLQEANIWKQEYQRIWQAQQNSMEAHQCSASGIKDEEQLTEMTQEGCKSNIWTIRAGDFECHYTIQNDE